MEFTSKFKLSEAREINPEFDECIATVSHNGYTIDLLVMRVPGKSRPRFTFDYSHNGNNIKEPETDILFNVVSMKMLEGQMINLMKEFLREEEMNKTI